MQYKIVSLEILRRSELILYERSAQNSSPGKNLIPLLQYFLLGFLMGNTDSRASQAECWSTKALAFTSDSFSKDHDAIKCGDLKLTYGELAQKAGELSRTLSEFHGLRRGSRVLVSFEDTPLAWISFGILQFTLAHMGACFSVLDTRSKSMSNDARAHVLFIFKPDLYISIGDIQFSHALLPIPIHIDWLHLYSTDFPTAVLPPSRTELSDGAFVDWTSGSTGGLPKGCVCTHKTLSNMYTQKWSPAHGFLSPESLPIVGFNLFYLWYWWQPLCHGGTAVFLLDSEIRDLALFTEAISRHRISAIDCLTPSLLKVICTHFDGPHFPSTILVSGEPLSLCLTEQFIYRFPSNRLINVFSTTETGDVAITDITSASIDRILTASSDITNCPIEKPLIGVDMIYLLIEDDMFELVVGGVGAKE